MARTHGRILCSIWDDPDFQELSPAAQRLYVLLVSQDTLNNTGRILLTVKRWSSGSRHTTPADIRKALTELDVHRFVVVDEDTEEVLIRSFIRNDGIIKQPQMMKSALREALGVRSARLRAVLAAELRKLHREDAAFTAEQIDPGFEPDPDPGDRSPIQAQGSLLDGFEQAAVREAEASAQSAELRRGRGRGRGSVPVRSSSVQSAAKRGSRISEDFTVTQDMVVWARTECPDVDGKFETQQFVDYWLARSGAIAVKLDWTRTWQSWMRKQQRDTTERGRRLRSVPSGPGALPKDPTDAFAELRRRGDAQEAARLIGALWHEPAKPPNDNTPIAEWLHARQVEWIDEHAEQIQSELTRKAS